MALRSIAASLVRRLRVSAQTVGLPRLYKSPRPPADVQAEVGRFFDDSSLSRGTRPVMRVIMGGVCTGKTTLRQSQCARGYVIVDAAEVFLALAQGKDYEFPSVLAERMNLVGRLLAVRAIREQRHIAVELLDHDPELFHAITAAGYRIELQFLTCDPAEAVRRNQTRGTDSISAYFAQPYHVAWLKAAASSMR